jgi:hypothetical protein
MAIVSQLPEPVGELNRSSHKAYLQNWQTLLFWSGTGSQP